MKNSALSIKQLCKIYANHKTALNHIDLNVEEGEFFGLLGPNGAGKSTTIGIVSSLVRKTSGTVNIFGIDIDTDFSAAKRMVGIVPQEFNFNIFKTPLNILIDQAGYYGVPKKIATKEAYEILDKLGIVDYAKRYSQMLSGGMKRRLMIARALVHKPKLLILDEPTAGVDIELRRLLWEHLRELNTNGTTIILTTHYLEEAESLCKRIAIINQGKIITEGFTRNLLEKLQLTTYVLDLSAPITTLPVTTIPLRQIDSITLEADIQKSQTINQLFAELKQHNIIVNSLRNKTNRLEELFVNLTKTEQ